MADLTPTMTTGEPCCAPEQQATCCEPSGKDGCCTSESSTCGCSVGQSDDARERGARALRRAP
jgi:hypothetical protein